MAFDSTRKVLQLIRGLPFWPQKVGHKGEENDKPNSNEYL
jgi:hypothetical protein